jgi:hypothetical protein
VSEASGPSFASPRFSMTLEIQNPRAGAALTDAFDLKGRVRPELEEFIVPTVLVADVSASAPPAVQRTATCYFSEAAVAGQRTCFQFICPPGTLAVIKRVSFFTNSLSAARSWFLIFSGNSPLLGKPTNQADMKFTDGRLERTGVVPSCQLWFGRKVSTLTAVWALPQNYVDASLGSAECVYEPKAGWIVGSGVAGESSYLEGAFDLVNTHQSGVVEWEEFQVG